jgi:TonB family protein
MKQLFSSAGRVSDGGGRGGGVSVSVAVHAAAIGVVLVFSGTRVVSQPEPPRERLVLATVALAAGPKAAEPAAGPPNPPSKPRLVNRQRTVDEPVSIAPPPPVVDPETDADPMRATDDSASGEIVGDGPVCAHCVLPPEPPSGGGGEGPADGGSPIRVSVVDAPTKIRDVQAAYPEVPRRMGIEGLVVIDCVIGADGRVRDARTISGNPLFYQAALEAVRQWEYSPPRLNGQPVSVLLSVTLRFRLNR